MYAMWLLNHLHNLIYWMNIKCLLFIDLSIEVDIRGIEQKILKRVNLILRRIESEALKEQISF